MNTLFLICFGVGILTLIGGSFKEIPRIWAGIGVLVLAVLIKKFLGIDSDWHLQPVLVGLVTGLGCALLIKGHPNRTLALSLSSLFCAGLLATSTPIAWEFADRIAYGGGILIMSLALGNISADVSVPGVVALLAASMQAFLSKANDLPYVNHLVSIVLIPIAILCVVSCVLGLAQRAQSTHVEVGMAVLVMVGAFVGLKLLGNMQELPYVALVAGAASIVVLIAGKGSSTRYWLSCALWVAVSTLAFSFGRSLGMVSASIIAVMVLATTSNTKLLQTCGVLVGLTLFRASKTANPVSVLYLELTHHQMMLSLLVGVILVILVTEHWDRIAQPEQNGPIVIVLMLLVGVLVATFTPIVLNIRAVNGLLLGLGIGTVVAGPLHSLRANPLGMACLFSVPVIAFFHQLQPVTDLVRSEKIQMLTYGVVVALILVGLITFLTRKENETELAS